MVVAILLGLESEPVGDRRHAAERADELDVATGELLVEPGELGAQRLDLELRSLGLEHGEIERALSSPRHSGSPPNGRITVRRGRTQVVEPPSGANGMVNAGDSTPPSTSNTLPVTQLAASDARYRTAAAMSSG